MDLVTHSVPELLAELDHLERPPEAAPMAVLDADGTLWAADVGLVLFEALLRERALRPEAAPRMADELTRMGERPDRDLHVNAARLFELYQLDRYPEADVCALMAWCFAGHHEQDVRARSARALRDAGLEGCIHDGLRALLEGLAARGLAIAVVSASPSWGVEQAVAALGLGRDCVHAVRARLDPAAIVLPEVETPIPYREGKVAAIRSLLGDSRPWLVFGDSAGDLPMLAEAVVPVAVQPRPAVLAAARTEPDRWRVLRFERTESGHPAIVPATDRAVT